MTKDGRGNPAGATMKATFKGVPGEEHESINMYGQTFKKGEAVDVNDPRAIAKLRNHPHFDVEESEEDRKLNEQVKREFAAAATAGLMEAQANAIRREQAAAPAEPVVTPTPPEPLQPALHSAQEYVDRIESGAGLPPQLTKEQLQEQLAQREEQEAQAQQAQESTDASNRSAARNEDPAKDQGRRAAADAERGRTGKGR